jgi:hypothetical protein
MGGRLTRLPYSELIATEKAPMKNHGAGFVNFLPIRLKNKPQRCIKRARCEFSDSKKTNLKFCDSGLPNTGLYAAL